MTPEQYREAIKRLGLNQSDAGAFIGVNPVTSRRWATGKADVPPPVSMLLRLMLAMKLSPEKVREWLADPS